jgi:hypothetical protein
VSFLLNCVKSSLETQVRARDIALLTACCGAEKVKLKLFNPFNEALKSLSFTPHYEGAYRLPGTSMQKDIAPGDSAEVEVNGETESTCCY